MTYGTRRPTLVLPASADAWTDDRRRAVLLHELAHVARRDCFVQRLTSLACALYWPHPGVWWAARRLRTERELACDDLRARGRRGPARVRRPPPRSRALTRRGAGARDRARHGARAAAGAPAARGPRCRAQPRGASPRRTRRRDRRVDRRAPADGGAARGHRPGGSAGGRRHIAPPSAQADPQPAAPARLRLAGFHRDVGAASRARRRNGSGQPAHRPFVARPDDAASRSSRR